MSGPSPPDTTDIPQATEPPRSASDSTATTISRAHKIKLNPNREQDQYFRRACGTRRFVYNWALAEWNRQYELHTQEPQTQPKPSWMALAKQLTIKKKDPEFAWLNEICTHATGRAVRDVGTAWSNFFKAFKRKDPTVRRPTFQPRGQHDRFYVHNSSLKFDPQGKHVHIARAGWVRCRESLRFNGKIMSGTVSRAADGWYLSIQVQIPHVPSPHPQPGSIGIDMGVANHVTLSDGRQFHLPTERMDALRRRLARQQKSLSRKWSGKIKKGHADRALRDEQNQLLPKSKRFLRQTQRVARLHQKIANQRTDALHKLSRWIVDHYDLIAIEDLKLRNMTASAKGTVEQPGRNVNAKAGLNRSMLNAALRQFRILLEYKSAAVGGHVQPVDPAHTSQTCCRCGHVDPASRPTQAQFHCVQCGHTEHADVNAAKNILARLEKGP